MLQVGQGQWGFTANDYLPRDAPPYHILRGRHIEVRPYVAKAPVETLEQEAMRTTLDMNVDRFLYNPDILEDIELMHNRTHLLPGMKRKQL